MKKMIKKISTLVAGKLAKNQFLRSAIFARICRGVTQITIARHVNVQGSYANVQKFLYWHWLINQSEYSIIFKITENQTPNLFRTNCSVPHNGNASECKLSQHARTLLLPMNGKFVKSWIIIGTLSHWYSFESAQRELSNEFHSGRVEEIRKVFWRISVGGERVEFWSFKSYNVCYQFAVKKALELMVP